MTYNTIVVNHIFNFFIFFNIKKKKKNMEWVIIFIVGANDTKKKHALDEGRDTIYIYFITWSINVTAKKWVYARGILTISSWVNYYQWIKNKIIRLSKVVIMLFMAGSRKLLSWG